CAEQRRSLLVPKRGGNRISKLLAHHRSLGVAAVFVIAGEARVRAEILAPAPAIDARPAGLAQPRDSDPIADLKALASVAASLDHAYHLMTGNHARQPRRQVALGDVQVCPAYAAG